jgi:hypothetical protein
LLFFTPSCRSSTLRDKAGSHNESNGALCA